MCVTVLIPTRNRPDTLRQAIASVLRQGDDLLHRVLVSDNSDDDCSAAVVAEFTHPSLCYERKFPVLHNHVQRVEQLYAHAQSEFCAILHDDDWWLPGHLSQVVNLLRQHPEAAFAGASHLYWRPEKKQHRWESPNMEWIAALTGADARQDHVVMGRAQTLAFTALGGFFHFSSMLLRRRFMDRMPEILTDEIYRYDTDRLHLALAADLGPVVYGLHPSVIVRVHPEQDSALRESMALRESASVSRWIWGKIMCEQPPCALELLRGLAAQALQAPKSELAKHMLVSRRWICYLPEMLAEVSDLGRLLHLHDQRASLARRAIAKAKRMLHRMAKDLARW